MRPTIITAADASFKAIALQTIHASQRAGNEVKPYDLGGLELGRKFFRPHHLLPQFIPALGGIPWRASCPWKPFLLAEAREHYKGTLVWLDADAWAVRSLDEAANWDCDVAVTMRSQSARETWTPWPEIFSFLNAGVIVLQDTAGAREFIRRWMTLTESIYSGSDQHALNVLVRQTCHLDGSCYNGTFDLGGIKIRVLHCDEWNFIDLPAREPCLNTKILHLKRNIRSDATWQRWLNWKAG